MTVAANDTSLQITVSDKREHKIYIVNSESNGLLSHEDMEYELLDKDLYKESIYVYIVHPILLLLLKKRANTCLPTEHYFSFHYHYNLTKLTNRHKTLPPCWATGLNFLLFSSFSCPFFSLP